MGDLIDSLGCIKLFLMQFINKVLVTSGKNNGESLVKRRRDLGGIEGLKIEEF